MNTTQTRLNPWSWNHFIKHASVVALLVAQSNVSTAQQVWDGTTNANWSTAGGDLNWDGGTSAWVQNSDGVFGATGMTIDATTVNIFNNLTFNSTGYTISSVGAGSLVLANDLASTITVTNLADTATIGETLANSANGASSLTKAGSGTLILTNVGNTFSTLNVSDGTLQASTSANINQTGLGIASTNISSGATLNLLSTNTVGTATTINNAFTGSGLLKLTFTDTTPTNTILNNIAGFSGTIRLANTGVNGDKLNITGANGSTAASLIVDNGNSIFANTSSSATFAGGISIIGAGNSENRGAIRLGTGVIGGNISLGGNSTIGLEGGYLTGNISASSNSVLTFGAASAGNGTLSGNISDGAGVLSLTKNNAGTLWLTGTNSYTGATTISASGGRLQLGLGGTTGSLSPSSAISVGTSATLTFNRSNAMALGTDFGNISGAGNVAQNGTGTTTYGTATAQTYTGQTQVNRGTLALNFANLATPTDMVSASSVMNLGGGTLSVLGKNTGTTSQTFASTTLSAGRSILALNRGTGISTTVVMNSLTSGAGSAINFSLGTAWANGVNSTTAGVASATEIVRVSGVTRNGTAITMPGAGTFGYIGANAFHGTGASTRYVVANGAAAAPYQIVGAPTTTAFLTTGGAATTVYSTGAAQTLTGATTNYALLGNAAGAITVANGGFAYTLNGFLNINTGTVTLSGTGAVTIGAEKDFVVNNANTGGLTISSVIANSAGGASSLTNASGGSGALTLSGANTYTGGTFFSGGVTIIATDGAASAASPLGTVPAAASAGNLTFNGGELRMTPTAAIVLNSNRGIALGASGGTISLTAAFAGTVNSIIAGVGGLTLSNTSTSTLAIGGVNTYTGGTTISGSGVIVPVNVASPFGVGGILTLNGGQLRATTAGTVTIANPVSIAANTTFPTTATEKSLIFTGPTVLAGGTRTLTVGVGGTVAGTFVQFTNNITESTALSGLSKAGTGHLMLGGLNTFTGPTSITAGRVTYSKNFALYANTPASWTDTNITVSSGATMMLNVGGINEFSASDVATISGLGTATGGFQSGSTFGLDTTGGNFTYPAIANPNAGANAINFLKVGANTLTLNGNNTYTGTTTIQGGTVFANGSSTTSQININGGTNTTLVVTDPGATGLGSINIATGVTTPSLLFRLDGGGTIALPNTLIGNSGITTNIDVNNNGTGTNGVVQLNGTATSGIGNVTLNITGGNGYSLHLATLRSTAGAAGTTVVNPTTANVTLGTITSGTALAYNWQLDGTSTGNAVTGAITNGSGGISVTKSNSSTWTLSGDNTYTGATVVNAGTLVLSGTNTGNGATSVVGGTLQAGANNALNPNSAVTMTDAATAVLDLNGKLGTIGSLAGGGALGGNVTLGSGTLTTGGDGTSTAFAGAISGGGNLVKTGFGTFTLNAAQSFTGTTTVDAGSLLVNNTLASSTVTVANAATLGGTGTLAGTTTISSGGNLSPATGTTAGTLTFGGLTLDAGSSLAYEFGGTSDLVAVTGVNALTLNGGALSLYAAGGVAPLTVDGTYTLFTYNTSFLGLLTNLSVFNSQAGKTYSVADAGGSITLTLGTASSSEWNGGASPDIKWTTAGNWTAGTPNSLGAVATLGAIPTTPTTINVDGAKTVGSIIFDNANSYTINGGASDIITLDNGIAAGAISVTTGNHFINAPIALNGPANLTPASGTSLTLGGVISGNKVLSVNGAGAVTLAGANTTTGGVTLVSGTLNLANAAALGSGTFTIAGGTLDAPAAALVLSTNNAQVWNNDFTFTGTNNLDLGNGNVSIPISRTVTTTANTLTVGGVISGAGLTKQGTGTLSLAGNNTFTGALTVSGGSVILSGNNLARPAGTSGLTTVNSGATLQLQANAGNTTAGISNVLSSEQTANQPLILNNGSTLQLRSDSAVTFAGANNMGGMGSATIGIDVNQLTGAGSNNTLTMAPGGFNVSATTFNVTGGNGYTLRFPSITSVGGNTSTYAPTTAKLSIGNYTSTAGSAVLGLAGTSTGNVVNGVIASANVSVLKTGTSSWELSGVNTYTGTTIVREGSLTMSGGRTGTAATITVSDTAGTSATLNITGGNYSLGGNQMNVGNAATTAATGTVNQSGGALSFTGGSQLLVGQNSVGNSGVYNLSGGSLTTFTSTNRGIILGVNTTATGTFNLSGTGTLNMNAASGGSGDSALQIGRFDSAADNTTALFNQTGGTANIGILSIGGSGATGIGLNSTLTITGGTFSANQFPRLAAGNTNTATINIGGTADVTLPAFPITRGTSSTATINFDGGVLRPLAASATYMGGLTNAFIKAGGAKFDVASGKDITITQNLLTDAVSLLGGLTKDGDGALTLNGTNTYTGGTTLNAGILGIGSNGALGNGTITINGGNLRASGSARALSNPVTVNSNFILGRATDLNGNITLTTDATITASNPDSPANSDSKLGPVSGAFRLTIQEGTGGAADPFGIGTGAIVVNAVNTNSGGTTLTSGRGTVTTTGALANADLVVNGGELNLNNAAQTVTSLSGSGGTINLGTGHILTVNQSTNTSFSGVLASAGSLVKTGPGTLTLTGANTYSGATNVDAGKLLANGTFPNTSVTIASGAILGGLGNFGGVVTTASSGSIIAPGASPGPLTVGSLNVTSGGTFNFELGTSSDLLSVSNSLTAGGTLIFNFSNSGGLAEATPYTLMTFGSQLGLDYPQLTVGTLPAGYTLDTTYGTGGFEINAGDLKVQFIPEPGTLLMGGIGLLTLLRRRRSQSVDCGGVQREG